MTLKLLTEHHLEFLSLKGGCTGSSDPTLVKMPQCWKSHVAVHIFIETNGAKECGHSQILHYLFTEIVIKFPGGCFYNVEMNLIWVWLF